MEASHFQWHSIYRAAAAGSLAMTGLKLAAKRTETVKSMYPTS